MAALFPNLVCISASDWKCIFVYGSASIWLVITLTTSIRLYHNFDTNDYNLEKLSWSYQHILVQNCILEKYVGPQSPGSGDLYSHRNFSCFTDKNHLPFMGIYTKINPKLLTNSQVRFQVYLYVVTCNVSICLLSLLITECCSSFGWFSFGCWSNWKSH